MRLRRLLLPSRHAASQWYATLEPSFLSCVPLILSYLLGLQHNTNELETLWHAFPRNVSSFRWGGQLTLLLRTVIWGTRKLWVCYPLTETVILIEYSLITVRITICVWIGIPMASPPPVGYMRTCFHIQRSVKIGFYFGLTLCLVSWTPCCHLWHVYPWLIAISPVRAHIIFSTFNNMYPWKGPCMVSLWNWGNRPTIFNTLAFCFLNYIWLTIISSISAYDACSTYFSHQDPLASNGLTLLSLSALFAHRTHVCWLFFDRQPLMSSIGSCIYWPLSHCVFRNLLNRLRCSQ